MMENWEIRKLGDFSSIKSGKAIDASEISSTQSNGLFPCFGGNGIRGYVKQTIGYGVMPIIGRVGALCGNVQITNGHFYATEHALVVNIKDASIYPYWYKYALTSMNLRQYAKGVAQPVLAARELEKLSIPVPPIAEQEKIVAELDCLTNIIEKKKQQLEELDKLAQSIFYDMFGDPITNEKGWEVKKLGDVCEIINGFAFKSQLFKESGDTILRISNIQQGYVDLSDAAYFNKADYPKVKFDKYVVLPEDIVIALSGATTGKLGINRTGQRLYLNQRVAICRETDCSISHLYLLYFLKTQSASFLDDAAGVAQPNLSTEQMKTYQVCIPSPAVQHLFAQKIEAIEKQKELVKRSIVETETLFNSRMDYWFN